MKQRQKEMYDQQHRVHSVPTLPDDTLVWVNTQGRQVPGRVVTTSDTPCFYVVEIPSGVRICQPVQHLSDAIIEKLFCTSKDADSGSCASCSSQALLEEESIGSAKV